MLQSICYWRHSITKVVFIASHQCRKAKRTTGNISWFKRQVFWTFFKAGWLKLSIYMISSKISKTVHNPLITSSLVPTLSAAFISYNAVSMKIPKNHTVLD